MTIFFKERGPLMVDISGLTLTEDECRRLCHPLVGGVILFRRNFTSLTQLQQLTAEIRALRSPALLIAVDQEGGRVQRFLDGFTRLPPMGALGELWPKQPELALSHAENLGYVLAVELQAAGVDLSFTPVLDLNWERCAVIKDRAFHSDATVVSELALSLQRGLRRGGMGSCGKHFPGHGWVRGDSHHTVAVDERPFSVLEQNDLLPFRRLMTAGMSAVMPAHVIYSAVDSLPAGFSSIWLQQILRHDMNFNGLIFSDDICMEGAAIVGDVVQRAESALLAGCDMVLICNRPDLADYLLAKLAPAAMPLLAARLECLVVQKGQRNWEQEVTSVEFAACQDRVAQLISAAQGAIEPDIGEA